MWIVTYRFVRRFVHLLILLLLLGLAAACQETGVAAPESVAVAGTTAAPPTPTIIATAVSNPTIIPASTLSPTQTNRPLAAPPTPTPRATSTLTPTPPVTATPTPGGNCLERVPGDDLFTIVTQTYGLSRYYAPQDLVPLADYLPQSVTMGFPNEVRSVIIEPLTRMVNDMIAAALHPTIISGYRSYSAQAIAYEKWASQYPEHVSIISAPPGHSEHQLGTVVDFGSPELPEIVADPDIEFHTYFYLTSEGQWLQANAHKYGFTLSYPREAFEITGFYYEPWHYRYVGVELATSLYESRQSLTEYLLAHQPEPCVP
jgi:zinc D-Ala-D-Ala carboxypeptidase